jgi:hypothetical protein
MPANKTKAATELHLDDGQTEAPTEGTIMNNVIPTVADTADIQAAPTSVGAISDTRTYTCTTPGCLDFKATHVHEPYVNTVLHRAFDDTRKDWYAEVYLSESTPEQGWVVEAQLDTSGPIPVEVAHEFMVTLTGCYTLAGQLNGAA